MKLKSLTVFSLLAILSASAHAQDKPELTIYTYDSFIAEWGPGPKIKAAFEKQCECEINFVATDSSTGILNRVRLEGESSPADIVLGLDATLLAEAKDTGLLVQHGTETSSLTLPIEWEDDTFLPFDYGYFAFIYNTEKLTAPPTSLQALADSDLKVIIQDPRSSTTGLGLLLWLQAVLGESASTYWEDLSDNVVTVTKGWSEAYGLFLEGEADMVLSYTTSPAYHMIAEGKNQYQAAAFSDGHGMQIEVAAKLKNAPNPALADQFMHFILNPEFQKIIPTGNWMYPVIDLGEGLPTEFKQLVQPTKSLLLSPKAVKDNKKEWLSAFNAGIAK